MIFVCTTLVRFVNRLSQKPPAAASVNELNRQTMIVLSANIIEIVLYVSVTISFVILVARMALSWRLNKRWGTEDFWMLVALGFLAGLGYAGSSVHYGTNNLFHPELLTSDQVRRRVVGSKMVLVGRLSYASTYVVAWHLGFLIPEYIYGLTRWRCSIWCMKCCILAVYTKIVQQLRQYKRFVKYIWACIFLTWIAVVVVTLFECRPFNQ